MSGRLAPLLAVLLLAACSSAPASPADPLAQPPGAPTLAPAPKLDLNAVGRALAATRSFRMDLRGKNDARDVSGTVEVALPDRYHVTGMAAGKPFQLIVIGDTTYLREGTAPWRTVAAEVGAQYISLHLGDFNPEAIATSLAPPDAAILPGDTETIHGVPCQDWHAGAGDREVILCVGADNLLYRASGEQFSIEFYDFNAEITITPPI